MSEVREVVVNGRKAWACDIDMGRPGVELVFQDNGESVIAFAEPEQGSSDLNHFDASESPLRSKPTT